MKESRKAARAKLKAASRSEYDKLIYEAKLTPRQEEIINLHILKDWSICKIALYFSCCESVINLAPLISRGLFFCFHCTLILLE